MANRLPIIAVVAAVVLFLIYSSVFVVNEREQAIVLRFGEIVDVKSEPGIYFKAPFAFFDADNVQIVDEAQHDRLLALVDHEDRGTEQEQDATATIADDGEAVALLALPPVAAGVRFWSWGSGR